MSPRRRFGSKILRSLLPILLLLALALVAVLIVIIRGITHPPRQNYLVTPQAFHGISGPVLRVADESWTNIDGTRARGWLLRGAEGAPAVVLLHRYGADRSWLFNLGIKINEATDFTILWPDLRGHALEPPVSYTTLGGKEAEDIHAALAYLRSLKTPGGNKLVNSKVGLYGVELGAYAAMLAAPNDRDIKVLVLDSVPQSADVLLHALVKDRYELDNSYLQVMLRSTARAYLMNSYKSLDVCEIAPRLETHRVLLLSGQDAGYLRQSTADLAKCFPNQSNVEVSTDLPLTGFKLASATGEQGEGYDRRVIEFFDTNLR